MVGTINKSELLRRWEIWEDSRGAYILSQKYRDELKEILFNGTSETIHIEKGPNFENEQRK